MDHSERVTALFLDGGGVRGLSSLLILKQLMIFVNEYAVSSGYAGPKLLPHQVFNYVAGTSTGGLIALMLGKIGMDIEQCIKAYSTMSSEVFGKKTLRGRMTGGLSRARYRGSDLTRNVRSLLKTYHPTKDEGLPMLNQGATDDKIKCAVVCREHKSSSKYSRLLQDAVCICSMACNKPLDCTVSDAARATSAAWTYFPIKEISGRYFSDGGVKHNNPSYAIWKHYQRASRSAEDRVSPENQAWNSTHGIGPMNKALIVSIGTGAKLDSTPARKREKIANVVPSAVKMMFFLKENLAEAATESDEKAEIMNSFAEVADGLDYWRLSASNGVCWIKLDAYRKLEEIEQKTLAWLQGHEDKVRKVAKDLTEVYLKDHLEAH